MEIKLPRDAFLAAAEKGELSIEFPTPKAAQNFRWRMYQIRGLSDEWLGYTIRRVESRLFISKPAQGVVVNG